VAGAVLIVASTLYIARREARLRTDRPDVALAASLDRP